MGGGILTERPPLFLTPEQLTRLLTDAYDAGFDSSGEGMNGEHGSVKEWWRVARGQFIASMVKHVQANRASI